MPKDTLISSDSQMQDQSRVSIDMNHRSIREVSQNLLDTSMLNL